ncbi:peptidoglycan-binding domain-containing protein [Thalassotalea euphylliae]|uniref:Peptidoglycan binding-like domain-containing protein n=1 Tax=Thalassotalea euphylliae TaxID=1655234 RepID=A0A3E0U2I4_9GAMM|nr:peptidoglycan-binding domain-containing protein [Thalassotalea euphylliae]REL30773.1 hypothetical protein DXX94_08610 [Thalassotalea euphylliae]
MKSLLFSVLLLSINLPVMAADINGKFAMKGAGFLTCQAFLLERQKRSNIYYMIGGWLEGYISAHNRYVTDTYDITAYQSLELLLNVMDSHCQSNPSNQLYQVVSGIIEKLEPVRIKQESPRIAVTIGERKVVLYRATIRKLQQKLSELELYQGQIDGQYTDATKSALMAYQSDIGFEMTGVPDQGTLWRLLK